MQLNSLRGREMRSYIGILGITAALAAMPLGVSFAHGGGSTGGGSMPSAQSGSRQPDEVAKAAYNAGVKDIKKAKEYDADAAKASTPEKSAKAADKAHKSYQNALTEFIDAVAAQPTMYEAWNYLGFANRHLGNYNDALASYAKALELNPNYPDAIEYRGEAYLGLNKIDDAKGAYMSLFRDSRPLADELMTAMHHWTESRRKDAQGLSTADIDAFAKWMDERSNVAGQTASLATGAPQTNWR
jgi:tetratricopeptide (TPR) repeat protein